MISSLLPIFEKERIDLYRTLPFSACRVQKERLLSSFSVPPQSVLMIALPYHSGEKCARLSKYAIAKDYHLYFKTLFAHCIEQLNADYPQHEFAAFYDHSPIAEIEAAVACGLGVQGDNNLLITEKYGSYVFLGEILSTIPYLGAFEAQNGCCLHCGQCKSNCPSPSFCLSAITQKKQALEEWEISLMKQHQTAWGCDICQDVCPMNRHATPSPIEFFKTDLVSEFTAEYVEKMSDAQFADRAFAWRGRACVLRNLRLLEEDESS